MRDPAAEMLLDAAANSKAHAIVTYYLRDFGPAKLFGIPVLNPEKITAMETAKFFEQRAALVNAGNAQAAWDKVGADAAVAEDTWTKQKAS